MTSCSRNTEHGDCRTSYRFVSRSNIIAWFATLSNLASGEYCYMKKNKPEAFYLYPLVSECSGSMQDEFHFDRTLISGVLLSILYRLLLA